MRSLVTVKSAEEQNVLTACSCKAQEKAHAIKHQHLLQGDYQTESPDAMNLTNIQLISRGHVCADFSGYRYLTHVAAYLSSISGHRFFFFFFFFCCVSS